MASVLQPSSHRLRLLPCCLLPSGARPPYYPFRPLPPSFALLPGLSLLSLPLRLTPPSRTLAVSDRYPPSGNRASQPYYLHLLSSSKFKSHSRYFMFGPSAGSFGLLCPRLTSATPSRRLSTPLAQGRVTDLPGYCALTFSLMPAASTH